MAGTKRKTTSEPTAAVGSFYELDADGSRITENPEWGSLTTKRVLDGLAAGTIEIAEEVPDAEPEVPASSNAAPPNSGNNS